MLNTRINTRLPVPLAEFVEKMAGEHGPYETPSEYIRDLIRKDMETRYIEEVQDAILEGYRDWSEGRVIKSSGNLLKDMKKFRRLKETGKI